MECIWTDKSYYRKGFFFRPKRARYQRFIEGSKIKANHWHLNFLLLYCIYTYNSYTCIFTITSVPRVRQIYKCEVEILMLLLQ